MRLCAWCPKTTSRHLAQSGSHEPYKNRDMTFFILHVTCVMRLLWVVTPSQKPSPFQV